MRVKSLLVDALVTGAGLIILFALVWVLEFEMSLRSWQVVYELFWVGLGVVYTVRNGAVIVSYSWWMLVAHFTIFVYVLMLGLGLAGLLSLAALKGEMVMDVNVVMQMLTDSQALQEAPRVIGSGMARAAKGLFLGLLPVWGYRGLAMKSRDYENMKTVKY